MQPDLLHPRLARRLLVAAAQAHHHGDTPIDWQELAARAGVDPRPSAINRSLAGLADLGLIEGVHTPAGWLAVRPTARGIGRAGRAGRRAEAAPLFTAAPSVPIQTPDEAPAAVEPRAPRRQPAEVRVRIVAALAPRFLAARTTLSQAWHTFTTLP